MKKYAMACAGLVAAGLAILWTAICRLPDQVPMHWNFAGEMDRMGSKYEYLIIVGIGILFSVLMLFIGKRAAKTDMERRILGLTAVFGQILFFGITFFALWQGMRYLNEPVPMDLDLVYQGTGVLVGGILILLGNWLPKMRRNRIVGIRLPWTMENDAVWQRSQRFGGISAVCVGVILLVLSFLLSGLAIFVAIMVLTTLWALSTVMVSWKYHKEEENGDPES